MTLRIAVALVVLVVASACSSSLSAEEYATRVEGLVATMADALVAANDLYHGEPTIENIRSFVDGRAEARQAFLEGGRCSIPQSRPGISTRLPSE